MSQDLTKGSVKKTLIRFGLPFLFAYMLQTVYSIVDMLIVSRFVSPDKADSYIGSHTDGMLPGSFLVLYDYDIRNHICVWI